MSFSWVWDPSRIPGRLARPSATSPAVRIQAPTPITSDATATTRAGDSLPGWVAKLLTATRVALLTVAGATRGDEGSSGRGPGAGPGWWSPEELRPPEIPSVHRKERCRTPID